MISRVKYFNEQGYNKKVQEYLRDIPKSKLKKESLISFSGLNTIEEIEQYLNTTTGFVNPNLSADALGLKDQYQTIVATGNVDLNLYNEDLTDLTPSFKDELREQFTTYWSDKEYKELKRVDKLVNELNKLGIASKKSILLNRTNDFVFNTANFILNNNERFL